MLFDIRASTDRPVHSGTLSLDPQLIAHLERDKGSGDQQGAQSPPVTTFLYSSAWKLAPLGGFVMDMQLELFTRVQIDLNWLLAEEEEPRGHREEAKAEKTFDF